MHEVNGLTRVKCRKQRCSMLRRPMVKVVSRSGTRKSAQPPARQQLSTMAASHTSRRLSTLLYSSHTLSCCASGASAPGSHKSPAPSKRSRYRHGGECHGASVTTCRSYRFCARDVWVDLTIASRGYNRRHGTPLCRSWLKFNVIIGLQQAVCTGLATV